MYVCSYMESCWAAALQACARGAGERRDFLLYTVIIGLTRVLDPSPVIRAVRDPGLLKIMRFQKIK